MNSSENMSNTVEIVQTENSVLNATTATPGDSLNVGNFAKSESKVPEEVLRQQLHKLEELGFTRTKQNLKLLKKTGGNYEVVLDFLKAKQRMCSLSREIKKKEKLNKKLLKLKRENSSSSSSSSSPSSSESEISKKTSEGTKPTENMEIEEKPSSSVDPMLESEELKTKKEKKKEEKAKRKEKKKEEKEKEKKEKKEKKDKKEKEKKEKKEKNDLKKSEKKEKKLLEKQFKSRERSEEKLDEEVSLIQFVQLSSVEDYPKDASHLYLDGNNMLYVCAPIRNLVIQRKFEKAEQVLRAFAKQIAQALGLQKCFVVFDVLHSPSEQTETFLVHQARPTFATSDDLLVKWAEEKYGPEGIYAGIKPIFVTSDAELIRRLGKLGMRICKPKMWFIFGAKLLSALLPSFQEESSNNNQAPQSQTPFELDRFMQKFVEQLELTSEFASLSVQQN